MSTQIPRDRPETGSAVRLEAGREDAVEKIASYLRERSDDHESIINSRAEVFVEMVVAALAARHVFQPPE